MIPLVRPATADAEASYVTRLRSSANDMGPLDSALVEEDADGSAFSGSSGLVSIDGLSGRELDGDVVLVQPRAGRIERLFRAGSAHNTPTLTGSICSKRLACSSNQAR
jgi:hypothetical protein